MHPIPLPRSALLLAAIVFTSAAAEAQPRIRIGTFDPTSPTWDRPKDLEPVSPTCQLGAEDATADGVPYAAFDLEVTAPENLEAEIVDEGTSAAFDPMLLLYCAPFDPLDPLASLVATNDDRAALDALPAFTADRGILLQPGQTYTIVVTTFDSGDYGTWELELLSPTAHFVPEPAAGGLAAALAIGIVTWTRGRGRAPPDARSPRAASRRQARGHARARRSRAAARPLSSGA
jgi:hypothetical protein